MVFSQAPRARRPLAIFSCQEDELLISVNILRFVDKPGQYMVSNETVLIALVAFAGGFKEDAKLKNV